MSLFKKQLASKTLIMYIVSALLFLTFVELHIHTQENSVSEVHGVAVSISTLADGLAQKTHTDEISVKPDSILKSNPISASMLAIFLLLSFPVTTLSRVFIGRLREAYKLLPAVPFHGTPPLRAPPQ